MNVLDSFKLDGKTALVTGARRGIGRAMAVALAEAGADIVGLSARLEPQGSEVARRWRSAAASFGAMPATWATARRCTRLIEDVKRECPPIDILVNNGGMMLAQARRRASRRESGTAILEVNLSAQFVLAREFGREMIERGREARSSSRRRCSAFREASPSPAMPRPRAAWRS